MANKQHTSDEPLNFSQRHGYEPLPEAMRLEQLSDDLRRELWNRVRRLLQPLRLGSNLFSDSGDRFVERVLGKHLKQPEDAIPTRYSGASEIFRETILKGEFSAVLNLVEIICDDEKIDSRFADRVRDLFDQHNATYALGKIGRWNRFSPQGSQAQGDAVRQARQVLAKHGMDGAATHLDQAVEHINARQYADAIADSILAVESVACMIAPGASKTLGPALDTLERQGLLGHRALKEAFSKLYGYTSDEQGIRHALLEQDAPDVGIDEALFMFSACASFAGYLVEKHRKAQESASDNH